MYIDAITNNLFFENGIWFSKDKTNISYPVKGNERCFQIEDNSFWFKHRNHCITLAVKQYSPSDVFLDIGGGNGFVAEALEQNNIKSILLEPGLEGAVNAKKRGLKNIICASFETAGLRESSVKAAGLFDVLEHIKDDLLFLKSVHTILAEQGLLYITVPAYKALWSDDDVDAGHFRRYSTKKLESILTQANFELVYSTYFFSLLPLPIFMLRCIPSKLRYLKHKKSDSYYKKEHLPKPMLTRFLSWFWRKELSCISQKKKIPFGSSCFIVARRK